MSDDQPLPDSCPDHHPTQHRDNKPPWCRTCGLTEAGQIPQPPLRPTRPPRPVTFDRTPTQSGALIIETSGLAPDDDPPSGALPTALVTALSCAMRADVNDGMWTGWEQTARAVLARTDLVLPATQVRRCPSCEADMRSDMRFDGSDR